MIMITILYSFYGSIVHIVNNSNISRQKFQELTLHMKYMHRLIEKARPILVNETFELENITNVGEVIKRRKTHLQRECSINPSKGNSNEENFLAHMQIVKFYKMVYCGIEKVGSTFWRRLIQLLQRNRVNSPFTIPPEQSMENYKCFQNLRITDYESILKENVKFLFVRNPYSRLLSGYVDKIFSPNPYFWGAIGKKAAFFNRRNARNNCGHDVTFRELINYFIYTDETNRDRDGHFLPATDHCRPCTVQYDIIGKMETFEKDVHFILQKFNLTKYIKFLDNFHQKSIEDAIYDTAQAVSTMHLKFIKCINYGEALRRIWRKLQIRGIIADEVKYPFENGRKNSMPYGKTGLVRLFKEAHEQSKKYNLKEQKRWYFRNAYNQIPSETMFKLKKIFANDFRIFGYEDQPNELFNRDDESLKINIFQI